MGGQHEEILLGARGEGRTTAMDWGSGNGWWKRQ